MYPHKYGNFEDMQISEVKKYIRKKIFFLLLLAEDMETREKYPEIDIVKAHTGIIWRVSGLNDLLLKPPELVHALSLLEEAKNNLIKDEFDFKIYRKLILDAGAEIDKIPVPPNEEVVDNV